MVLSNYILNTARGSKMDSDNLVIELLEPIILKKENCNPLVFEQGTILKVVMHTPTGLLVSDDSNFNFTVSLNDKNKVWREL
jgi:hypothetical protein